MVMSWGLQHLRKVMSVLAYYKDQTVLADKRRKKKNSDMILYTMGKFKWVSGKASKYLQ